MIQNNRSLQYGQSQFLFNKWILLISTGAVSLALIYITAWSFVQTRNWFRFMDSGDASSAFGAFVSFAMALVFQYGQGPALFLRAKYVERSAELKSKINNYGKKPVAGDGDAYLRYERLVSEQESAEKAALLFGIMFFVFAAVDAWTNVKQLWLGIETKRAAGEVIGQDRYIASAVIGVVTVFVEEGLGVTMSIFGHSWNDIREINGKARLRWLDLFAKIANDQLSGGMGSGIGTTRQPEMGSRNPNSSADILSRHKEPFAGNLPNLERPIPRPVPGVQKEPYPAPTYHNIRGGEGGDGKKSNYQRR